MNKLQEDIKNNKNIIIIADHDYFPLLLKYKDKSTNIKFISYQQAISSLTFEINEAMLASLIKNGIEYTKAKQILANLQLLPIDNIKKGPKVLLDAYKTIKPFIKDVGYDTSYIFKNKEIYLFNQKNDIQLINLFKSKDLKVNHLSIEDLGIEKDFKQVNNVINFDNKLQQYFYVFANIRNKLLANPEMVDNIKLLINDKYDLFYLNLFSKLFGIDIYVNLNDTLYNQPVIIKQLKSFYNSKTICVSSIASKDDASLALIDIIKKYDLEHLSFDTAYSNLLEIVVQTKYCDNSVVNKGILATNEYVFDDKETYVLCFQNENFYKFYKDTDAIRDISKNELGLNASYIHTSLEKIKKLSYIKYSNIALLSRVKQHLNEHIYDSDLINELSLKPELFSFSNEDCIKKLVALPLTTQATNYLAAMLADMRYDVKQFKQINSYNNQPDGIKVELPSRYSVSAIQQYNECPFKYLLEHYTTLSSLDDRFFRDLGTLLHSVLEHVMDKDFNYDVLFDKEAEKFKKTITIPTNGEYDKKYDAYLLITKKWFRYVVEKYRKLLKNFPNTLTLHKEVKFNFKLDEINKDFTGKIDLLILSQFMGKKFYTIVDYKTGSTQFEPLAVCVGQNIQLPMYAYSLPISDQKELVKGYTLGGYGLKHILGSSPKKYTTSKRVWGESFSYINESSLCKYTEASLVSNDDDDDFVDLYKRSIFYGADSDKGDFVTDDCDQMFNKKESQFTKDGAKFIFNLEKLAVQAKKAVIETIKKIEMMQFPIVVTAQPNNVLTPAFEMKKNKTNCRYCKYADICYRSPKDCANQSQHIKLEWSEVEDEE